MKNIIKSTIAAVLALACVQQVQAIPVTGTIGFTGGAVLNTASAGTATGVNSWLGTSVLGTSGSFTAPLIPNGTPVTFNAPWSFNSGLSPLWTLTAAGQTWVFNLTSSGITSQVAGSVFVRGLGTVTGSGAVAYTATPMSFGFTAQDPSVGSGPAFWTFSASTSSVPDGASTAMLLGMALMGIEVFRRSKLMKLA